MITYCKTRLLKIILIYLQIISTPVWSSHLLVIAIGFVPGAELIQRACFAPLLHPQASEMCLSQVLATEGELDPQGTYPVSGAPISSVVFCVCNQSKLEGKKGVVTYLPLMASSKSCLPTTACKMVQGLTQHLRTLLQSDKGNACQHDLKPYWGQGILCTCCPLFQKTWQSWSRYWRQWGPQTADPLHTEKGLLWLSSILALQSLPLWEEKAVVERHSEKLRFFVFLQRAVAIA